MGAVLGCVGLALSVLGSLLLGSLPELVDCDNSLRKRRVSLILCACGTGRSGLRLFLAGRVEVRVCVEIAINGLKKCNVPPLRSPGSAPWLPGFV